MKSRKLLAVICRNPLHFDFAGALVSPHVASGFAFLLTKQQFFVQVYAVPYSGVTAWRYVGSGYLHHVG